MLSLLLNVKKFMEFLQTDVIIFFALLPSDITRICNEQNSATKEQTSKPFTRDRVVGRSALKLFSTEDGLGLLPILVS